MSYQAPNKLVLTREPSTDAGTFGVLHLQDGRKFHSLELPWRDNARQKSCIPAGTYECALVNSPKFGLVYGVKDVPGRSHILFHAGNVAGDSSKGFKTDVEGCILLGAQRGKLHNQPAVLLSKSAIQQFMKALNGNPFTLEIREV